MSKMLTDITIRNLKPGPVRREIPDAGARGLYVVIQPGGAKSFAVRYRYGGKPRKLTLTGGISLAAARKAASDALYEVEQGRDPSEAKKFTKAKAALAEADTVQAICEEYLAREGRKLRTASSREATLKRLVFPGIGNQPINSLRRSQLVRLLDKIEDQNGERSADIVLAYLSRVFNWHAGRSDEFRTPIARGMRRRNAREHARNRILTDDELRNVWQAADTGPFGYFVKFLLLTAARRGEAAAISWKEISGADWTLPASRNKTKVDVVRPLSAAARQELSRVPKLAGTDFVFSIDGYSALGGFTRRKRPLIRPPASPAGPCTICAAPRDHS
jgi:integrase